MMRLNQLIKEDGLSLKKLSEDIRRMERRGVEGKYGFVKEMDGLNDELGDLLRQLDEQRFGVGFGFGGNDDLEKMRVLELFLEEKVKKVGQDNVTGTSSVDDGHDLKSKQWEEIKLKIHSAMERYRVATKVRGDEKENLDLVSEKALELRKMVQEKNTEALGDAELDELERLWEENFENDFSCGDAHVDAHAHADVYSQKNHKDEDCDGADDAIMGGNNDGLEHSYLYQQQQPANMHLFYGEAMNAVNGVNDDKRVTANDSNTRMVGDDVPQDASYSHDYSDGVAMS